MNSATIKVEIFEDKLHNSFYDTSTHFNTSNNTWKSSKLHNTIDFINLINPKQNYTVNSFDLGLMNSPYKKRKLIARKSSIIQSLSNSFDDSNSDDFTYDDSINVNESSSSSSIYNNCFKYDANSSSNSVSTVTLKNTLTNTNNNFLSSSNLSGLYNLKNFIKKKRIFIYSTYNKIEFFDCEYVNFIDYADVPIWKYVVNNITSNHKIQNFVTLAYNYTKCCNCDGQCWDSKKCLCTLLNTSLNKNFKNCYEINRKNVNNSNKTLIKINKNNFHIYECSPNCLCNKTKCELSLINHVKYTTTQILEKFMIQRIRKTRIHNSEVITKTMWGLFTKVDIKKNSFVIEYCGEIITNREAETRGKFYDIENISYLFDISEDVDEKYMQVYKTFFMKHNQIHYNTYESQIELQKDDFPLVIDAMEYGNFARFINHSCVPNLRSINIHHECKDPRFSIICLFSIKDIKAGTELTMDYNYGTILGAENALCLCGEKKCRNYLYRGTG